MVVGTVVASADLRHRPVTSPTVIIIADADRPFRQYDQPRRRVATTRKPARPTPSAAISKSPSRSLECGRNEDSGCDQAIAVMTLIA